ncbi:MAG: HDOD domain-containing protein [Porticoccus sp.]|nr:HDOD domain-containing protein [Porticoccus sp.]
MNKTVRTTDDEEVTLDFLMALQPVYTRNLDVAAFELLLEDSVDKSTVDTSDLCSLVLDTYGSIYQNGKVNVVPVFLEIPESILLGTDSIEIPSKQYILEITPKTKPTPEIIHALRTLSSKGYRIALSDYQDDPVVLKPLLEVIHIVKFDITKLTPEAIQTYAAEMKAQGLDLLVEGLISQTQFRRCLELGFHFFSGDFLKKPKKGNSKPIGNNKLLLLELLGEIQNPESDVAALESIASRDPNLAYKLLRIINSAAFGFNREIDTLGHAINILGMEQLGRWVTLFLLEGNASQTQDLMRNMLVCGRMCEILAELTGRDKVTSHFIAGLLSQLDILMEIPMDELMEQVPLNQEIKDALLSREGSIGEILTESEHYEKGRFLELSGIVEKHFYEVVYRHSTEWAKKIMAAMNR